MSVMSDPEVVYVSSLTAYEIDKRRMKFGGTDDVGLGLESICHVVDSCPVWIS